MNRGEVWLVRLPPPTGHTQSGTRPCVIVQDEVYGAVLPTVLIIPFTGSLGIARFPGTLEVQPYTTNGLTIPSVALVFQLHVVDRRQCLQKLGDLDIQTLDQLFELLDRLTGR